LFPSSGAWQGLDAAPAAGAPLAVLCAAGTRAALVASLLARNGREDLTLVRGGMVDWLERGYPVAARA
ncbi:MAG TPA: rhodanese-like domain-containing protein, partial [Acidimicrobiales bacterium]|nr:rhodanese-like domain-containing protein [Acidimicrobiales bacterium]